MIDTYLAIFLFIVLLCILSCIYYLNLSKKLEEIDKPEINNTLIKSKKKILYNNREKKIKRNFNLKKSNERKNYPDVYLKKNDLKSKNNISDPVPDSLESEWISVSRLKKSNKAFTNKALEVTENNALKAEKKDSLRFRVIKKERIDNNSKIKQEVNPTLKNEDLNDASVLKNKENNERIACCYLKEKPVLDLSNNMFYQCNNLNKNLKSFIFNEVDNNPHYIEQYKLKISLLEQEKQHLIASVENEKTVFKSLLKRIEYYSKELNSCRNEINNLIKDREYATESLKELTIEHNLKLIEINFLNEKVQNLDNKINEIHDENVSRIKENLMLKESIKMKSDDSIENQILQKKNFELIEYNNKINQNFNDIKNECLYNKQLIEEYQSKLIKNESLLLEKQRELITTEEHVSKLNFSNEQNSDVIKSLQESLHKINLEKRNVLKINENNNEQVEWLNEQLENLRRNYNDQSLDHQNLYAELSKNYNELQKENNQLSEKIDEFSIRFSTLNQTIRHLNDEIADKKIIIDDFKGKIMLNENLISKDKEVNELLTSQCTGLKNLLEEKNIQLIQIQNLNEGVQTNFDYEMKKNILLIDQLNSNILELNVQSINLKDNNSKLDFKVNDLTDQLIQNKNEIRTLNEDLTNKKYLFEHSEKITIEKQTIIDQLIYKNYDLENKLNHLNKDSSLVIIENDHSSLFDITKKLQVILKDLLCLSFSSEVHINKEDDSITIDGNIEYYLNKISDLINKIKHEKIAISDIVKEINCISKNSVITESSLNNINDERQTFFISLTNTLNSLRHNIEKIYSCKEEILDNVSTIFSEISINNSEKFQDNQQFFSQIIDQACHKILELLTSRFKYS